MDSVEYRRKVNPEQGDRQEGSGDTDQTPAMDCFLETVEGQQVMLSRLSIGAQLFWHKKAMSNGQVQVVIMLRGSGEWGHGNSFWSQRTMKLVWQMSGLYIHRSPQNDDF